MERLTKEELTYLINMVRFEEHDSIDKYNDSENGDYKIFLNGEIEFLNSLFKKLLEVYKENIR